MVGVLDTGPSPLFDLLAAKSYSDRGDYARKHALLRRLLRERPDEFTADSGTPDGMVGLTHAPTGFRVHVPARHAPRHQPPAEKAASPARVLAQLASRPGLAPVAPAPVPAPAANLLTLLSREAADFLGRLGGGQ